MLNLLIKENVNLNKIKKEMTLIINQEKFQRNICQRPRRPLIVKIKTNTLLILQI